MSKVTPPPPLPQPSNRLTVGLWSLLLVAGIATGLVLHFFPPGQYPIYPVCPLHQSTGLDCPGCGGLRAMHQLTNGNFAAAWRLNPFVFVLLPLFAYEAVVRVGLKKERLSMLARPVLLLSLGAVLLAFSLVRNLPKLAQWFS
jgi:hypothetical protein